MIVFKLMITMSALTSFLATAQTLSDYYGPNHRAEAGQVICGTLARADDQPRCFVGLARSTVVTLDQDQSGKLKAGATNAHQGAFDRVEIQDILIETDTSLAARGERNLAAPRNVLAKVRWSGRAGAALNVPVAYQDVVIGTLAIDDQNNLAFTLIEVPTQMSSLGFMYPQRETALIFGGDANSPELKKNVLEWMASVVGRYLPPLIEDSPFAPKRANLP